MVLKITKETWEKCGIKTIEYYNKKENLIELWNKMRVANIYDLALKRIGKKQNTLQKK